MGALKRPKQYRMPPLKRHDGLTPNDAATLYAVTKARPPKQDESDAYDLAREFNADVDDVLELVCERRAIRMYEGNHSPESAAQLGLEDARVILLARLHR